MNIFPIHIPGGSDGHVQYNKGDIFGGDSAFTWDDGAAKALTIGNCAVLGSDSALFQPNADSTTFFQILDADGGIPIFNVDSTNERVGIGISAPLSPLHVQTDSAGSNNTMIVSNSQNAPAQVRYMQTVADDVGFGTSKGSVLFYDGQHTGFANYEDGKIQFWTGLTNAAEIRAEIINGDEVRLLGASPVLTFYESSSNAIFGQTRGTGGSLDIRSGSHVHTSIWTGSAFSEITTVTTIGLGVWESSPETPLELTHTTPYITLHNDTHEDADGGRESRLNFKGEQSGGEETTLARIEAGHDGVADDQLGRVVDSVNTGAGLVEVMRKESNLDVTLTKIKLTAIGGFAIKLTNKTGANTVAGQLVKADTATDDAVILTAAGDNECFGVFLDSGIADGSEAWVVVAGICDVAMEDNTAATHGNWVETSDAEVGYADATSATPAAAPAHFEEIGHCVESVAAGGVGTHILARCVLHFN